jgi:murein DD-endopeptidase MepM/ murein hydrolase activator NlpD
VTARRIHATLVPLGAGEAWEHLRLAADVVRPERHVERAFKQRARPLEATSGDVRAAERDQCRRARRRCEVSERVDAHAELDHELERTTRLDRLPDCAQRRNCGPAIEARNGAPAGDDKVIELEHQRAASCDAPMAVQRAHRVIAAEASEVHTVPRFARATRVAAARRKLLRGVAVDGEIHAEARLFDVVARLLDRHARAQQALVDEGLDDVDDRRRVGELGARSSPPSGEAAFALRPKSYPEQRLTVARRHVDLSPKDLARYERERVHLADVSSRFTASREPATLLLASPADGPRPSSFGLRRIFNGEKRNPHSGMDIAASAETPVVVAAGAQWQTPGTTFSTATP